VDESQNLASALWESFRDEIATGERVFFCFSQETLRVRLAAVGLGAETPLSTVCSAAGKCFDVEGDYVSLRPAALLPGSTGISMAIVLVCQQVLAVEEMVREGSVSENAYFPRLRALMSAELPRLSANPFRFDEFEAIWRRFAKEIRAVQGSTDETITFEFGAYSGVNKARLFPLSQALLSRADLSELLRHCRLDRLRMDSVRDVWNEIRGERNHLTRRGQRLVNTGFLRERIAEQVQNYARRSSPPVKSTDSGKLASRLDQLDLAISLDVTDWVQEEYRAFLTVRETSQRIDADRRVAEKLNALLAEQRYVFCSLGNFGDYWIFREGTVEVGPGDTLLVVGTDIGIQRARAVLDGLSPPVRLEESRIRGLGTATNVRVCPVSLPSNLSCKISIRAGRMFSGESAVPSLSNYDWLGGICLDRRSRKYLREALPYGVRFGVQEFLIGELSRVGDLSMSWDGFERAVRGLETDASYDLRYPNGRVARLAIGVARPIAAERMGFPVDHKGFLSPTLEPIGDSDASVVGFSGPKGGLWKPASTRALANLLRDLASHNGRRLTEQECQRVWCTAEASPVPNTVKQLIRKLLGAEATVRESTLNELLSATK
jgi:hypothetical protein